MRTANLVWLWLLVGACGARREPQVIEVCGRGDLDELRGALRGGQLDVIVRDGDGVELERIAASVEQPTDRSRALPAGAASIDVEGRGADGSLVAIGHGAIVDGRACACVALSGEYRAACEAVGCQVTDDACAFLDPAGAPLGSQTLVFGDNADDDVAGVVRDTYLSLSAPDSSFGDAPTIALAAEPAVNGLVEFDLGSMPTSSRVEAAELELSWSQGDADSPGGTLAAFAVLEAWDEGEAGAPCASWNCRLESVAWAVPGCGYLSEVDRSREQVAQASGSFVAPGDTAVLDVTAIVAAWVADPASNRGLALGVSELGGISLVSSEGQDGPRPRLRVRYRLGDEGSPPDAGGDVADAGPLPDMVVVPEGPFVMGCDPSSVPGCPAEELPEHTVMLSAFEIDTTEVTNQAYAGCEACSPPACGVETDAITRARYPVVCVTHQQAIDYCAWVGKRLPTEAEWEKAANGTVEREFPWGDSAPTCQLANYFGCVGDSQPVGLRREGASPYGVLDMAGNVSEWVADYFGADYYGSSPAVDPPGAATGTRRVRRGGAFPGGDVTITVWNRGRSPATTATRNDVGFRCARSL